MALIAWTDIKANKGLAKCGSEVSAESLGLTKKQFDELILAGAVRDKDFPLPKNYPYSVRTFYLQEIQKASGNQEKALELILEMKEDLSAKPPPMALPPGVEPGVEPASDAASPTPTGGSITETPASTTQAPATTEAPKT